MERKEAGERHEELWEKAKDVLYEKYGPLFGGDDWDGWFEGCYERLIYIISRKVSLGSLIHGSNCMLFVDDNPFPSDHFRR